jgi:hypothetical protein
MHQLRLTKIRVLEIVWSYLYSGRQEQAWHALVDMWPGSDVERIRAILLNAWSSGIRRQLDGSGARAEIPPKHVTQIYGRLADNQPRPADPMAAKYTADIRPRAILLRRVLVDPTPLPRSEETLDLVIDGAGKVRSARTLGRKDNDLINDCLGWKFIPAFKEGRPVASRMQFAVSLLR